MEDLRSGRAARPPSDLVMTVTEALAPAYRPYVWDCRQPARCVPLRPSSAADPPPSSLDASFIRAAAGAVGSVDEDLLDQIEGGADDGSTLEPVVALAFHHHGLRHSFAAALEAVQADVDAGFISTAHVSLPFVPCRLVPKNVVQQIKWSVTPDGTLSSFAKPRVRHLAGSHPRHNLRSHG